MLSFNKPKYLHGDKNSIILCFWSPELPLFVTGEVGKEMYIVNRGRLHVVADNGKTVLATLKPGMSEISLFLLEKQTNALNI